MSVDPSIRAQVMEILSDPMSLPPEFWGYDVQNWMKEAPVFPISQVFGASRTLPVSARVNAAETTSSTSFGDLATVGPTLSGLPDGTYVVWFGAAIGGASGVMSFNTNGAGASDGVSAYNTGTVEATFSSGTTLTLSNGGTSELKAKYRAVSGTPTFNYRWMIALRAGNL